MGILKIALGIEDDNKEFYKELRNIGVEPEAGDTTIKWNGNDSDEVLKAKAAFNAAVKQYGKDAIIYSLDKSGKKDKELKEFDPLAEEILILPRPHPGPDPSSEFAYGSEFNMSEIGE